MVVKGAKETHVEQDVAHDLLNILCMQHILAEGEREREIERTNIAHKLGLLYKMHK